MSGERLLTSLLATFGLVALVVSHPRTRIFIAGPGKHDIHATRSMECVYARNPLNPLGFVEEHVFPLGTPIEEQVRATLESEFYAKPIWWTWLYGRPGRALPPFWWTCLGTAVEHPLPPFWAPSE